MSGQELAALLEGSPIIAAVKDDSGMERCLKSGCQAVFVLYGDLISAGGITARLKAAGKTVFLHLDRVEGLAAREAAADFAARYTEADGILSTKAALVHRAKALGLLAVQRFFLLDSIALESARRQLAAGTADLVEILPGVMPKIIRQLAGEGLPLITGGLISDKEDVVAALSAGACAVSTTNPALWEL